MDNEKEMMPPQFEEQKTEYVPTLTLTPEEDEMNASKFDSMQANLPTLETPDTLADIKIDQKRFTEAEQKMIEDFSKKIDITDANTIMQFGTAPQKKLADFSSKALDSVRTKDLGDTGKMLSSVVTELKDFDPSNEDKGVFGFFNKTKNKIESMTARYEKVEKNVDRIAGTLQEPTIGFDIRLPNADASVEEEVFAFIDRNSERDMLNQTLSLLAMGHFYNANGSAASGNIATSGSISALNSILSDVTGIDIGVDYKMGNELTKNQVDVNISKDWGRWYLESTLGYGGESRELQSSAVNSAVIDALVGYRISPLVHLFAYNRTNTNDYTRMDLPYKQGVGLKLTKDFDNWGELFKKKKKK